MARFCTQCGVSNVDAARFCEECGTPLKQTVSAASPVFVAQEAGAAVNASAAAPGVGISKRKLAIVAGIAATLLIAGGGLAVWLAPESPSEASFKRAMERYLADNADARDKLLCVANMRYQGDAIRVAEYDAFTRNWMDALAQSGVYAPAQVVRSNSGFLTQTQYVYALTEAGKPWIRNNRLCLGDDVRVTTVSGFDQVQKNGEQSLALARAQLEISGEAPWLKQSPQRDNILQKTGKTSIQLNMPVTLVDGKWKVVQDAALLRRAGSESPFNLFGRDNARAGRDAAVASGDGFLTKIKRWFSFGGHPLVGKWREQSGLLNFEFTNDQMIEGGSAVKARFETDGDTVKIWPEQGSGLAQGLVVTMQGQDTAIIDMGLIKVRLLRVK
ncbi:MULTISPECIES: zinc-ribbon domain-containing protein [unclassified Herbaspirillum]|uniref:zinc-ribbon domain-containing protein n=1 Tax=unclassified Herbaspirillum TaxID=2624150 RepID=UPI00383A532A